MNLYISNNMSGHSKWATIHREKEASDQKRGQVFTKIANAITIAVRDSGGITDPESNFKLRLLIEKAREVNMPKDNIQRAINRAVGKIAGGEFSEVTYEGYGPGGVGILVEAATDNKQRTVQEVKNIFDKSGGSVASPGSVAFNFKKVGMLCVPFSGSADEAMLKVIDLGAEDVENTEGQVLDIYISPENLMAFKEKLISVGMQPSVVEIVQKPINFIPISDGKTVSQVLSLVEKLENLDDVQKVYANFDIPDKLLKEQV